MLWTYNQILSCTKNLGCKQYFVGMVSIDNNHLCHQFEYILEWYNLYTQKDDNWLIYFQKRGLSIIKIQLKGSMVATNQQTYRTFLADQTLETYILTPYWDFKPLGFFTFVDERNK